MNANTNRPSPPYLGPPPGMPKPGQGMDPMMAMLGGMPMMQGMTPPPGPPMGPGGLPVGGSLPRQDPAFNPDMGGSNLLKALNLSLDPDSDTDLDGLGSGDPNMGIEKLIQLLALGQMGAGGTPPGGSGVDRSPVSPGTMLGF